MVPLVGTLDVADGVLLEAVVATLVLVQVLTKLEVATVSILVPVNMENSAVAASVVLLSAVTVVDVPTSQESALSWGLVVFVNTCKPSFHQVGWLAKTKQNGSHNVYLAKKSMFRLTSIETGGAAWRAPNCPSC